MAESIVTSVPDPSSFSAILPNSPESPNSTQNHIIHLDLRNDQFTIEREALIELPESILLCLFPNGVVLSQKRQNTIPNSNTNQPQPHEVYYVDFDGPCLSYILNFFNQARLSYYGTTTRPAEPLQLYAHIPTPLFYRQAVIVLREELEFFVIPNPTRSNTESDSTSNQKNKSNDLSIELKKVCGRSLLADTSIFTALQRNIERENNNAEKHLIEMLCMSGFDKKDHWGYRTPEPKRCAISSLALVLLKTGITHGSPPTTKTESNSNESTGVGVTIPQMTGPANVSRMTPQVNAAQLNTAQKLLLFWRKPARKCWWDATEIHVQLDDNLNQSAKLWARRVWTLELSLI